MKTLKGREASIFLRKANEELFSLFKRGKKKEFLNLKRTGYFQIRTLKTKKEREQNKSIDDIAPPYVCYTYWIAFDNRTAELWQEEFETEEQAINYIKS